MRTTIFTSMCPPEPFQKTGPSAGITLTTALASLLTGKSVSPEFAMTGEVSLTGRVMPIAACPKNSWPQSAPA